MPSLFTDKYWTQLTKAAKPRAGKASITVTARIASQPLASESKPALLRRSPVVGALDISSRSRLGRVLAIQNHDLCSWSRPQLVEAVLKPTLGPRRRIAVPQVVHRFAHESGFPVHAPTAIGWLTPSGVSACTAVATLQQKSGTAACFCTLFNRRSDWRRLCAFRHRGAR